jgi:hypothetical protein
MFQSTGQNHLGEIMGEIASGKVITQMGMGIEKTRDDQSLNDFKIASIVVSSIRYIGNYTVPDHDLPWPGTVRIEYMSS